MISLKANLMRPLLIHLTCCFLMFSLNHDSASGQDPGDMLLEEPPYASDDMAETTYNYPIAIDVLMNDFGMSYQIDPATVTITSGPTSGTTEVDPLTGVVTYTPDTDFYGYDQFSYEVSDTNGNVSNTAYVDIWVENFEPMIDLMIDQISENTFLCSGYVNDENPAAATVVFDGLAAGRTATPDSSGYYDIFLELEPGEGGVVYAQAIDEVGAESAIVYDEVTRY